MDQALRKLQSRLIPMFLWGTLAVVLSIVVAFAMFLFRQDLSVVNSSNGTFIDVQWLGEYQANVRRIRISQVSPKRVVWEIAGSNGGTFPLWQVAIQPGENAVVPVGVRGADVISPRAEMYTLLPELEYRVDLWATKDWGIVRHVTTTFRLRSQGA